MVRRQNPKIERTLKRTSSVRQVKQTFLIVCEGEVTEPEYLNSFRLTSAYVKAIGKGMNTISLVKEAIAMAITLQLAQKILKMQSEMAAFIGLIDNLSNLILSFQY